MIQDDPKSSSTLAVGAVSGLTLLLLIFLLQIYYYKSEQKLAVLKAGDPGQAAQALRAEQEGLLEGGYHWIDEERGVVALPIERAMERIAERTASAEEGR
jgi:hypothetical protein